MELPNNCETFRDWWEGDDGLGQWVHDNLNDDAKDDETLDCFVIMIMEENDNLQKTIIDMKDKIKRLEEEIEFLNGAEKGI